MCICIMIKKKNGLGLDEQSQCTQYIIMLVLYVLQ